jgi:hypothetical protein
MKVKASIYSDKFRANSAQLRHDILQEIAACTDCTPTPPYHRDEVCGAAIKWLRGKLRDSAGRKISNCGISHHIAAYLIYNAIEPLPSCRSRWRITDSGRLELAYLAKIVELGGMMNFELEQIEAQRAAAQHAAIMASIPVCTGPTKEPGESLLQKLDREAQRRDDQRAKQAHAAALASIPISDGPTVNQCLQNASPNVDAVNNGLPVLSTPVDDKPNGWFLPPSKK